MSSVYVTNMSYVSTSGAGGSMNVTTTSPTGLTINNSEEVFLPGEISNTTTVEVTDSVIRYDGNDLLLGGKGDDTLVGDLDTDTLTRGADTDSFVTSTPLLTDVITDFDASGDDTIGIAANKINPKDLVFAGSDSTSDGLDATLIQYQDNLLDGISSFYF